MNNVGESVQGLVVFVFEIWVRYYVWIDINYKVNVINNIISWFGLKWPMVL